MKHKSLWQAMKHSVVVVLVLSACFALFAPPAQASAGWIGQSGGSTTNAINYTSYGWLNIDQAEIRPFGTATTSVTIDQDFWKTGFTSGVDLDQARLYYKTNSSSFGTANDGTWTVVNGTITAIGSSDDDRTTFTLSATAGTDVMFYIRYTDGGADAYGFPGASSPWTTAPSSQSQTYKIRFNSSSTYNAKRVDGLTHDWQINELLGTVGSTNYYLTWDDTNLYVRISGGFADSDQIQVALDTNPGTNDVTGSSATGEFSRATFAGFLTPDYLIRSTGTTNLDKFTRSGTSWGSGTSISPTNLSRSGATAEIQIPRSEIGNLSAASAFGVYFWLANSGGNLYVSYGTDNPTSCSSACRMRTETGFTSSSSGITPSSDQKADHNNSETRTLSITSLRHLYVSNGTATLGGLTTAAGNLTIGSSTTLATNNSNLNVAGDFTNNGTFMAGTSAVAFNGTNPQTIGGTSASAFHNVTLNNTSATGVTLGQHQNVNNILTFNNSGGDRLLRVGNYDLTMGSAAQFNQVSISPARFVVTDVDGAQTGRLCKVWGTGAFTYPIGDARGTVEYSPVSFTPTSPSGLTVCFRAVDEAHPNKPTTPTTDYLTRYWSGTTNAGSFTGYTGVFTFINTSSDVQGSTANMLPKRWTGAFPWEEQATALGGATVTWNGGSTLSDFTAFKSGILAVTLADFFAQQVNDHVRVTWETASELGNMGFNLYRGTTPAGPDRRLNALLIPSQSLGNPGGFTYTWDDSADLVPGVIYYYWVEDVDVNGAATRHGPVSVDFSVPTAVTLNGVQASPAAAASLPWLWIVAGAGVALALGRRR